MNYKMLMKKLYYVCNLVNIRIILYLEVKINQSKFGHKTIKNNGYVLRYYKAIKDG